MSQQPHIAIYARYSSELQNPRSCEDQEMSCREFIAKQDGYANVPIESYKDEKISGFLIKDRPEMIRLLKDVEDKKIRIIFSEALSRLSRSLSEAPRIYEICRFHDVQIHTLQEGVIDGIRIGVISIMDELGERQTANFKQVMAEAGNLTLNGVDYPRMQLLTIANVLDGVRFETPSRALGRHEPQPVLPNVFNQPKKGT